MRIFRLLQSLLTCKKLILGVLLFSVSSVAAMEYGDTPQTNAAPTIGSWLYRFIKSIDKKTDTVANSALYAAPMVAAPAVARSNKTMLLVAGGLLALWASKKLYNWMYIKPKNGE